MNSQIESLNYLFISKVRVDLLKLFFFNSARKFHIREATRLVDQELNAVRRELMRLSAAQLLITEKKGNRVYFYLNLNFLYFKDIQSMFFKRFGLGSAILNAGESIGVVRNAIVLEPYLNKNKSTPTDLDFVLIGEIDAEKVDAIIQKIQEEEKYEINYAILKPLEFDLRIRRRDAVAWGWVVGNKVEVIGNLMLDMKKLV